MVDVGMITYTHENGESLEIKPLKNTATIEYEFRGKDVEPQNDNIWIEIDPNRTRKVVTCSTKLVTAEIVQLDGYIQPASAPTYDGTYPNVAVKIDGTTTWTILCMVIGARLQHRSDNKWIWTLKFTERSDNT